MHEIFHALGRWHEQSRPDRDEYVRINEGNIIPGQERNFRKLSLTTASTQGIPYDYRSLMHYRHHAFSRNGHSTITPIKSGVNPEDLGQRNGFTDSDVRHVNALYGCGELRHTADASHEFVQLPCLFAFV